MTTQKQKFTVKGQTFLVWSDFTKRSTLAEDPEGNIKTLRTSGYLSAERTIKREIKLMFAL